MHRLTAQARHLVDPKTLAEVAAQPFDAQEVVTLERVTKRSRPQRTKWAGVENGLELADRVAHRLRRSPGARYW